MRRQDIIHRIRSGDLVERVAVSSFSNSIPFSCSMTNRQGLTYLSTKIANARRNDAIIGHFYEMDFTFASGDRESVLVMVEAGGRRAVVGLNRTFFNDVDWFGVNIPEDAPKALSDFFVQLSKP
jgi:hypothetical protein